MSRPVQGSAAQAGGRGSSGLTDAYRSMTPIARVTFWACLAGCALDNFDFLLFSFIAPALTVQWRMGPSQIGLIATCTLVSGAVGGIASGLLADRIGRLRVLKATVLWFALCTFACGFAQNPLQLAILRTLQGLGFGGELVAGAVLLGEMVAPAHRGRLLGGMSSGWTIGGVLASGAYTAVFSLFPETLAWRVLFWLGVLPALLVLLMRRNLVEAPRVAADAERAARPPVRTLFAAVGPKPLILGTAIVAGATGGTLALFVWLPTFLKLSRGLSVAGTGFNFIVTTFGSFAGYMLGAWCLDRLGRRPTFIMFAALTILGALAYVTVTFGTLGTALAGAAIGLLLSAATSGLTTQLNELFPASSRATGVGLCYSLGRAIGAFAPAAVGALAAAWTLPVAIGGCTAACFGIVLATALLLPETRGRPLFD